MNSVTRLTSVFLLISVLSVISMPFSVYAVPFAAAPAVPVCMGDGNCGGNTYASENAKSVFDSVLRLHILAESDDDRDQAIKLEVRDAVLELTSEFLRDCRSLEEAKAVVIAHRDDIIAVANAVLAKNGAEYSASLSVGREMYPERDYGGQVYPAGEYTSVRILLGSGEGHNWWCVLFPSLCLSPAVPDVNEDGNANDSVSSTGTNAPDDAVEVGLTPGEYRVITGTKTAKMRLRFRFLELIGEWLGR